MTDEQIKALKKALNALEKVLKNPEILTKNKISPEALCSMNYCAIGVIVYYYWHMYEVNQPILIAALKAAEDIPDLYNAINEIVSAKWLRKAKAEIKEVIAEIENSSV